MNRFFTEQVPYIAKKLDEVKTGRILDDLGKPNRKMCSLSLINRMGVRLDSFGDSKARLAEDRLQV